MKKLTILLLFILCLNQITAQQNLELIIPETSKKEIYNFKFSENCNFLILNDETIINFKDLTVDDREFRLLEGSMNYFLDTEKILTIGDLLNNNKMFVRSITNNLPISNQVEINTKGRYGRGIFYLINDSTFMIDFSFETQFYSYENNILKLINVIKHKEKLSNPNQIFLSPINNNKLALFDYDELIIYDYNSKRQTFYQKNEFKNSVFIPNKFLIISPSNDNSEEKKIYFTDVLKNKKDSLLLPFEGIKDNTNGSCLRPILISDSILFVANLIPWNGKVGKSINPFCVVINIKSRTILKTIFYESEIGEIFQITNSNISDTKNIIFRSLNGTILCVDVSNYTINQIKGIKNARNEGLRAGVVSGMLKYTYGGERAGHIDFDQRIKLIRDDQILVINKEEYLSFYDLKSKTEFLNIFLVRNNEKRTSVLWKIPKSNYFNTSKFLCKELHYTDSNLNSIGFEQLDPVYNRPDIVLDSISKYFGNEDRGMIEEYRKAWEKHIDRLGLDKERLGKGEIAVPSAEIVDADNIAYENKEGKLDITVSANDPKYPLRRFNVYVNEVPLYGSTGISITDLKKQVWDTTLNVPLSFGENKIQVSVMNELGLENFKYPTYVNYTPDNEIVAKTYYIGIGVNEFKESSHNLKYCVKDVTDLAQSFGGPNTEVKLFTDKQVTKENILALKEYLNKTSVNDKVIISCSSHGLLDDSLNFYLAMHDVDFNNPKARGLKYEELESLLDGIPARQKLLLLDACNSGENDKTELLKQELQQKEKKMDSSQVLAARGVIIKLEEQNKSNFKKMNELFVNLRNNTGSVIISAAGGQESALEGIEVNGKKIENGAFTHCVLEYMKANEGQADELTVNKLKQYVENRVKEITNGKQKPTSRQETMEVDWKLR